MNNTKGFDNRLGDIALAKPTTKAHLDNPVLRKRNKQAQALLKKFPVPRLAKEPELVCH